MDERRSPARSAPATPPPARSASEHAARDRSAPEHAARDSSAHDGAARDGAAPVRSAPARGFAARVTLPRPEELWGPLGGRLRRTFLRPQMVAFLPALLLGGYWFGGQGVLVIVALTFPLLIILGSLFDRPPRPVDPLTGLPDAGALAEEIDAALFGPGRSGRAIVIALEIDGAEGHLQELGAGAMEVVLCRTADRLSGAVRTGDFVARIGRHRFGVLLTPARAAGMDLALRAVERLQGAAAEPVSIDAGGVYLTLSAGFCLERRAPRRSGAAMIEAAATALEEARASGEGAVRAYVPEMRARADRRQSLAEDLSRALEEGEFEAWFQPQVCAATGRVSGMEALARWRHPDKGMVPPSDFLPVAEATGDIARLGEVMLFHSLSALRHWDRAGIAVPKVGVNFATAELRDPRLVERVAWELDRFDLAPERLAVEILETVVAEAGDETIAANIAGLAALGCLIDLDDFGTGTASIASIRRFAVARIKIDRSFVTRADCDPGQRKMLDAILSMAAKLDLDTVAEGVETPAEQRLLAEMGCGHLQGFGVARPMAQDDATEWLRRRAAALDGAAAAPTGLSA